MYSLHKVAIANVTSAIAHTCRYVLDIGQSEDWLALQMSMAPCLLGYGMIARRLHANPSTKRDGNIYWKWIENYVADDYSQAVETGSGKLSFCHSRTC